jgi:uncharacterized protein (TIGR02996 family)
VERDSGINFNTTMSLHEQLLLAITHAPADDLPRLIFADWLEEQGAVPMAEWVRGQLRLGRVEAFSPEACTIYERLNTLPAACQDEWLEESWELIRQRAIRQRRPLAASVPDLALVRSSLLWQRGLPVHLSLRLTDLSAWADAWNALFDLWPVVGLSLRLDSEQDLLPDMVQWQSCLAAPWWKRIEHLYVFYDDDPGKSPATSRVSTSSAGDVAPSSPGETSAPAPVVYHHTFASIQPILDNPALISLKTLGLIHVPVAPDWLRQVVLSSRWPQWQSLDIVDCPHLGRCLSEVLPAARHRRWRRLHVSNVPLTSLHWQRILTAESTAHLEEWIFQETLGMPRWLAEPGQSGSSAVDALSAFPAADVPSGPLEYLDLRHLLPWSSLRLLYLAHPALSDSTVGEIAQAPVGNNLRYLTLCRPRWTDTAVASLAAAHHLHLYRLHLSTQPPAVRSFPFPGSPWWQGWAGHAKSDSISLSADMAGSAPDSGSPCPAKGPAHAILKRRFPHASIQVD